ISSYRGAAGPVRGGWVPNVMLVAVTPGTEALLELDEPQPASASPAEAITASVSRDLGGCNLMLLLLVMVWADQAIESCRASLASRRPGLRLCGRRPGSRSARRASRRSARGRRSRAGGLRSEEQTSELQSL